MVGLINRLLRRTLILIALLFVVGQGVRWFNRNRVSSDERLIGNCLYVGKTKEAEPHLQALLDRGYSGQQKMSRWLWYAASCHQARSLLLKLLRAGATRITFPALG